jgi:hypothetical protein
MSRTPATSSTHDTTAGNNAYRGSRLEHHAARHLAQHFVRDCRTGEVDNVQVLAGAFRSLAHRIRHRVGFADTHGNGPLLVTHHHGHAELKAASTLYNLSDARNLNDTLFELVLGFEILLFVSSIICHIFLH